MPYLYSLTRLTGARRNEDRRTVVFTFEVRRHTLFVVTASVILSALPTLVIGLIVGPYALIVPLVFVLAGLILWDTRQRRGLKLRTYQAIVDRRKASNGVLYASGAPIPKAELIMHQQVVVPARPALAEPGLPTSTSKRDVRGRSSHHGRSFRRLRAKELLG